MKQLGVRGIIILLFMDLKELKECLTHMKWKGTKLDYMRIIIIAACENRDRQKFISKPLLRGDDTVEILRTRPFLNYLKKCIKLFFDNKTDIAIFMGTGPKDLIVYFIIKLKRIPFIIRFGGDSIRDLESITKSLWNNYSYFSWLKYKFDIITTKFFLKKAMSVILVNKSLQKKISKYLEFPYRVFIIPQFCDGSAILKEYTLKNPVEILTVTNFQFSQKAEGVIWLIKQLERFVFKNYINVNFSIAGGGLHLKDIKECVKNIRSKYLKISILGNVSEIDDFYVKSDVFLYRSYHDATPNVILESKRFGLPLLVNDCEEFRNIVNDSHSGLLFRSEDDFQDKLQRILNDFNLRKKLGMEAIKEHESKFSIVTTKKKIKLALTETIKYNR